MFLKPFRVKSQSEIKGTERKKLKSTCKQCLLLTDESLNKLIPNKISLKVLKLIAHDNTQCSVYIIDGVVMLFSFDADDIIPTVYAQWKFPEILTNIVVNNGLEKFIGNGSDIMNPGIITSLKEYKMPEFLAKTRISVSVFGSGNAFAVGYALLPSEKVLEPKGKAIGVLHFEGDKLCELGNVPDKIVARPCAVTACLVNSKLLQTSMQSMAIDRDSTEGTAVEDVGGGECGGVVAEGGGDRVVEESVEEDEGEEDRPIVFTTQEMDNLVEDCFFSAIKDKSNKITPPILSSSLTKMIYRYCPMNSIDFKRTTFKKISVFYDKMMSLGILSIASKDGVDTITGIDFRNKIVTSHKTLEPISSQAGATNPNLPFCIKEIYQPTSQVFAFLKHVDKDASSKSRYEASSIRMLINTYIQKHSEYQMNHGMVRLDPLLTDAMKGKNTPSETILRIDTIVKCIIQNGFKPFTSVERNIRSFMYSGTQKKIEFAIVTKKSNKKVTTIKNLSYYLIDDNEVATEVKLGKSCATFVTPVEGKNDKVYVTVQGNQIRYLRSLLIDKYDIRESYMTGLDKMLKKK